MDTPTGSEFKAFDDLVRRVMAVPAETIKARVEEHRREAQRNPNRRGPKPKVKTSGEDRAGQHDRA